MADRLKNKVAIVTGATSGIGRAITVLFTQEGAKVVFAESSDKNGLELETEIINSGREALFIRTDVTKKEELQYLVKTTIEKFGRIDILVNNAGAALPCEPSESNEIRDYDEIFSINVKSYLVLCREVLPFMIHQQSGSIINTAATAGEVNMFDIVSYAVSNGAIKAFTRSLAAEYADQGIRVNSIMPGLTLSEPFLIDNEHIKNAVREIPMGRAASPEEIAYGFLFFASEESSFCTGSNLVIDGGATAI